MASCDHCPPGRAHAVLIAMDPGADGKEWFLCRLHWVDGLATRVTVVTELHEGESVRPSTGDRFQWTGTRTTHEVAESTASPDFGTMTAGGAKVRPKKRSTR